MRLQHSIADERQLFNADSITYFSYLCVLIFLIAMDLYFVYDITSVSVIRYIILPYRVFNLRMKGMHQKINLHLNFTSRYRTNLTILPLLHLKLLFDLIVLIYSIKIFLWLPRHFCGKMPIIFRLGKKLDLVPAFI